MQNEDLKEKKIDLVATNDPADTFESLSESNRANAEALDSEASNLKTPDSEITNFPNFGDRYQPLASIGHGAMGLVYKAKDNVTGSTVAIKVLKKELTADKTALRRFEQEVASLAELDHESLVALYGQGQTTDGTPYLVMEYVEGTSLASLLKQETKLSPKRAIDLVLKIADGVEHAHKKGIVHRDLKPSNIMIIRPLTDNDPIASGALDQTSLESVRILDFGIAHILESTTGSTTNLTQTGDVLGTPSYMSPEQCEGKPVDSISDIYALGCILYEMLTGKLPFEGSNPIQVAVKHINDKPENFPTEKKKRLKQPLKSLESITLFCLGKNKADRYQTIAELVKDLKRVDAGKRVKKTIDKRRSQKLSGYCSISIVYFMASFFAVGYLGQLYTFAPPLQDNQLALPGIIFLSVNFLGACTIACCVFRDRAAFRSSNKTMTDFWSLVESTLFATSLWSFSVLHALSLGLDVSTPASALIATPLAVVAFISGVLAIIAEIGYLTLGKFRKKFLEIPFSRKTAKIQAGIIGCTALLITILCSAGVSTLLDFCTPGLTRVAPHAARIIANTSAVLNPASIKGLENRADLNLVLHENKTETLKPLNDAIRKDPKSAELLALRAKTNRALGESKNAIKDYSSAIQIEDKFEWYRNRAELNVENEKYQEALSDYTEALKRDPTEISLYTTRGVLYARLKDYKLAVSDLSTALASKSYESADPYLRRAIVYELAGNTEMAKKDYLKALKLKEKLDSAELQFVYKKLGMQKEYQEVQNEYKVKQTTEELKTQVSDNLFKETVDLPFEW
jgi:serine/threonine protein kinase/Tfp pilus assembly protein PilF